jgi:hypothetical protein
MSLSDNLRIRALLRDKPLAAQHAQFNSLVTNQLNATRASIALNNYADQADNRYDKHELAAALTQIFKLAYNAAIADYLDLTAYPDQASAQAETKFKQLLAQKPPYQAYNYRAYLQNTHRKQLINRMIERVSE